MGQESSLENARYYHYDYVITNAYVILANNSNSLERIQTCVKFYQQIANDLATPALLLFRGSGHSPEQMMSPLKGKHFPYWTGCKKCCAVCAYKSHIQVAEKILGQKP